MFKLDRTNGLPDCLLAEIISHLNSTKESIRTGLISKRWELVWKQLPILIFNHYEFDDYQKVDLNYIADFYSSIKNILIGNGKSKLKKIQLHMPFDSKKDDLESFIRQTIDLKVEVFDIDVWDFCEETEFSLPDFFFRSSSFRHLSLSLCCFEFLDIVCWKNLSILHFQRCSLNDDIIQKILAGTPLLEKLFLVDCESFQLIDISNKSVKSLMIYSGEEKLFDTLQINAPYINYLKIKGQFDLEKLLLLNMFSVIQAELSYSNETYYYYNEEIHEDDPIDEELLKGLILSLSHVKELKVGKLCLKVLNTLRAKGFKCPSNLKIEEIDSE